MRDMVALIVAARQGVDGGGPQLGAIPSSDMRRGSSYTGRGSSRYEKRRVVSYTTIYV